MTFLSQHFGLDVQNDDFDFLDINLDKDTWRFVDPYAMSRSSIKDLKKAHKCLQVFMEQTLIALNCYTTDPKKLRSLWIPRAFSEPKGTGIGMSEDGFKGKGSSDLKCNQIITALRHSEAVQTGCLNDLEELILVLEGVGADTISDMTLNISKLHFIEYTIEKCKKIGIPTKITKEKIMYFCQIEKEWKKEHFELPHAEVGKDKVESYLIFIPEEILERNTAYGSGYFYTNTACSHFENLILNSNAAVSFIVSLKNGSKKVSRKKMRSDERFKGGKKRMDKFISNNPDSLKEYRRKVADHRYKNNQKKRKNDDNGL